MKYIIILITLFIFSCDKSDYKKIVNPAYEIKRADKNPNPVFDGEVEPPIPTDAEIEDEDNILGPDRNNNGVRDDIDIWINRTAKNYNERMAMKQFSRSLQSYVKGAWEKDFKNAENYLNKIHESDACLMMITLKENKMKSSDLIRFISFYPITGEKEKVVSNIFQRVGKFKIIIRGNNYFLKYCSFNVQDKERILE